jgi:dihydroxyacetone kinase DhaKLM complex PTS-EIIA-like component DhaM
MGVADYSLLATGGFWLACWGSLLRIRLGSSLGRLATAVAVISQNLITRTRYCNAPLAIGTEAALANERANAGLLRAHGV